MAYKYAPRRRSREGASTGLIGGATRVDSEFGQDDYDSQFERRARLKTRSSSRESYLDDSGVSSTRRNSVSRAAGKPEQHQLQRAFQEFTESVVSCAPDVVSKGKELAALALRATPELDAAQVKESIVDLARSIEDLSLFSRNEIESAFDSVTGRDSDVAAFKSEIREPILALGGRGDSGSTGSELGNLSAVIASPDSENERGQRHITQYVLSIMDHDQIRAAKYFSKALNSNPGIDHDGLKAFGDSVAKLAQFSAEERAIAAKDLAKDSTQLAQLIEA